MHSGSSAQNRVAQTTSAHQQDLIIFLTAKICVAGAGFAAYDQRAKVLAACGWGTRLLPAPKSAELRRWDSSSKQAANLHRAVLHCQGCGAQVGLWALVPRGKATPAAAKSSRAATGKGANHCLPAHKCVTGVGGPLDSTPVLCIYVLLESLCTELTHKTTCKANHCLRARMWL